MSFPELHREHALMEGRMPIARKVCPDNTTDKDQQPAKTADADPAISQDRLLEAKTLGYANQRSQLREVAERAADAAGVPPQDSVDEPKRKAWMASVQPMVRIAFVTVLAFSIVLALYRLAKVGTFPAALFGVFVAATVSSTVGFAFSAIAAAILLHMTTDQIMVVEIMLISSIALQTYCVVALWRDIKPARVGWFLLGGVATLPVGVYLLLALNTPSYAVFIGVFLALYGTITLWRPVRSIARGGPIADTIVGSTGGIVGPLVAFPGAVVAIWCGVRGWDKTTQRGVYQPYILVMQIFTLAALSLLGETHRIDMAYALFAVPAVLGAYIGFRIFEKATDAQFRVLVNALLIVSGLGILGRVFE
jgi:uncharacterized protein